MPAELKNVSSAVYDGESGDEKTDDKLSPYSSWRRRPLSGLLWQMTFFYGLLICVLLILLSIWTSYAILHITIQGVLLTSLQIVAALLIVIGVFALFFLTLYLLRPLRRTSDAAQAITLGDLQQRKRLLPLMKGDNEVSRIATSLSIMGEQLERATKAQQSSEQRFRRFISDASHQLRTPLTSIRGFTEVLMRGAKDDPETALRVLKRMKSESERMTSLINDILTLARLDEHTALKKQYVNLVELATEGIEQAKGRNKDGRTITLKRITQKNTGLQADKERLKQLLFVLLDNALKHGRAGTNGIVTLQLDKHDNQAIIRVIDNGEGISKEDMGHIFDSFYRGHQPAAAVNGGIPVVGTGLGLTIAAAIVRAHNGTISAQSESGKGTEFTVTLPCID